jgi:hypothetical protein
MTAPQQSVPSSPLVSQPVFLVDANGNPLSATNPLVIAPQNNTTLVAAKTLFIAAGTAANTVVKGSAGTFYGVFASTTAAGAGQIYDNATTNSGTPIGIAPTAIGYGSGNAPAVGIACANGIVVAGSATNPALTIFYN